MREIKFRAYDKKRECIKDVINIDFNTNKIYCVGDYTFLYNGKFELIQYTGLKDKNGVEIYDGYILQYNDCFLDNTKPLLNIKHIGRIEATDGGFVFVRQYWWNDPFYPEMGEALADMQTKSWIRSNCEVIGNIYENPELLEDKQ